MVVNQRVALLGAGLAAGPHLRALSALDCEVATVVTHSRQRLEAVQARFPRVRACRSPQEALDDDIDVALVLTPPAVHLEMARMAADRGIDLVVEKPLDISLARAGEIVRITEKAGVGLAVCYQHRAKPAAQALHHALGQGVLGDISAAEVVVPWWRSQDYYDQPGRGSFARDGGGVLITQAVHMLDLLVWYLGLPRRVAAIARRAAALRTEVETILGALLDYGEVCCATFFATTAAYPGADEEIRFIGERGCAVMRGACLAIHPLDKSPPSQVSGGEGASVVSDPGAPPWQWHRDLLADAFAAFATKREPLANGPSAMATQRVVDALYRAARQGEWVSVDSSGDAIDEGPHRQVRRI